MKIINVTQRSSAWFQCHVGCVSASYMEAVFDFTQKGAAGSKRKTYLRQKLAELVTGIAVQDNCVSYEMQQGIDREPDGIAAYEREEQCIVEPIGFALHDTVPRFGCSPDGLVGEGGGLELKCPKASTHLQYILDGVIPEQYILQIDSALSVTGRAWWDFATFCPEVPKPLQIMVIRRERDEKAIAEIERRVTEFNAELDAMVARLKAIVGDFLLPAAGPRPEESNVARADDTPAEAWLTEEDFEFAEKIMGVEKLPQVDEEAAK